MVRVRLYANNDGDPENAIDIVQVAETVGEACIGLIRQAQELYELAEWPSIWEGCGELVSGAEEFEVGDFSDPDGHFKLTADFGYDRQISHDCPVCELQRSADDSSTGRA